MSGNEKFFEELSELVRKHELSDCVFSGTDKEKKMFGFFCIERYNNSTTPENLVSCGLNAARLYQSIRERILQSLDKEAGRK